MGSARTLAVSCVLSVGLLGGCTDDRGTAGSGSNTNGIGSATAVATDTMDSDGSDSNSSSDTNDTGNEKFDVGTNTGGLDCSEGGDCPECEVPEHVACDGTNDPITALGLNCPGEPAVMLDYSVPQHPGAIGVRSSFGTNGTFNPREGANYAVISSGFLAEMDDETPAADDGGLLGGHSSPTYCNDDIGADYDPTGLPAPLVPTDVGAQDCADNPALVGTGDCSNTIQGQFEQGGAAYDYTEIRFTATVPAEVNSFSYDFAFFSTEYPYYYNMMFNDMYVGWLESEAWTGNISFDELGNPISLNAGFLDYRDDGGNLPEFAGTCMKYHAGTKWLSTTAGVVPGEQITVVFAIFDLADSILDSYAFLDNFQWGCDGTAKPTTKPVG